jgi:hypothetical protein
MQMQNAAYTPCHLLHTECLAYLKGPSAARQRGALMPYPAVTSEAQDNSSMRAAGFGESNVISENRLDVNVDTNRDFG